MEGSINTLFTLSPLQTDLDQSTTINGRVHFNYLAFRGLKVLFLIQNIVKKEKFCRHEKAQMGLSIGDILENEFLLCKTLPLFL